MKTHYRRLSFLALGVVLSLCLCEPSAASSSSPQKEAFNVPVDYYKLKNGLKVVLSEDKTSPTVVVAVYYNIGFRIEPKDRTGFAHLFEHMMFQGSQNLGKMEFVRLVQQNGGVFNGSTRFDFTNYFQIMPAHKLETLLWAEADRMRGLDITEENLTNQQGVVKNEVKVNVLNTPYGGFPWLDVPQYANENWYNAHNFYGDIKDLDAATLKDVKDFFDTYYAPNNAVLAVVGDFESKQARDWIDKYFSGIPATKRPPQPDLSEPRQEKEKKASKTDTLAKRPALAFAYHMPERNTPEYYAMGLLDQLLAQGDDSLLYQELVQRRGMTGGLQAGINWGLGNMFNYNGPMLWMVSLYHDSNVKADDIMAATDTVIEQLRSKPIDQKTLDRGLIKLRSSFYDTLGDLFGFGRADLLASFALFDDDPSRINRLETEFRKITPELIQRTAREYLRPTNRTVLAIVPGSAATPAKAGK
ncbi:MAG TPA: pitrilysin family protein [Pyrinomonadaceae bacterium]